MKHRAVRHLSGLLALIPALVTLSADSTAQEEEESPRPRSVLFYLIDTCRGDRVGFSGYERMTTPFLSWLAERSVVFDACFSQAPWTKPSMASMLSSQYPSTTGVYKMGHRLSDTVVTWPEVLRDHGYFTAGFSTNIIMGNFSNYTQGFDHFVESLKINHGDPINFASGSAKKLNKHALPWLKENDDWPVLLYMHSVDPHEQYAPKKEYLKQFADPEKDQQFRKDWYKLLRSRPPIPGLYVTDDNFRRTGVDQEAFIEHGSNLYDADLLANDDQMKILWDALQEDGWGEDFIFVFTSDHGEEFYEHGGTSHGYSLYDEMIRVPLLIYAPGLLPEGQRIETPVRSLDIYPTLCELLDCEIPKGVQGQSLLPLIRGEQTRRPAVISEHREDPAVRRIGHGSGVMVSVRQGPWKFILNQTSPQILKRPRYELFHLEKDPEEQHNVADEHPDLVQELEMQVAMWVADHRKGESAADWVAQDPEVLAQLRALGYIAAEPSASTRELIDAVKLGDAWKLKDLLDQGGDPSARDENDTPLLILATVLRRTEAVMVLLARGADVGAYSATGSTALHTAAFFGYPELVAQLLHRGANPKAAGPNGATALDSTRADWSTTNSVALSIGLTLDRAAVRAGRVEAAQLLKAALQQKPSDESVRPDKQP